MILIHALAKLPNFFKRKYLNLSIKYKILLFYFLIASFVCIAIGSYSYTTSAKNVQNQVNTVNLINTKHVAKHISFIENDLKDMSTFICLNSSIQSILENKKGNFSNYSALEYQATKSILLPLTNIIASKDYISFIGLYGNNGFKYDISNDTSSQLVDFNVIKKYDIYKKAIKLKGAPLWSKLSQNSNKIIKNNNYPKIAMCRTILDFSTMEPVGFLVMCIDVSFLDKSYYDLVNNSGKGVLLLDNHNNIISHIGNNKANIKNNLSNIIQSLNNNCRIRETTINNIRYLVNYSTINPSNWKIIYLSPVNELLRDTNSIFSAILFIIIICLVVSLIISVFISSFLTSPIKSLLQSMNRFKKGEFNEKVIVKYNDEVGLLGKEYNKMTNQIRYLIERVYKLQLREKEAELKALQSQINPHFLYNTLDTIYWKAEKSHNSEISEMIYSLSKLFRLTLNKGQDLILIRNEIDFIKYYLSLQKKVFSEMFDYEIYFDETISNYYIPKLLIQPFVENSIVHAAEVSDKKIHIKITSVLFNDQVFIMIEDNGPGIASETLDRLISITSKVEKCSCDGTSGSYAIKNIQQRLKLYFGDLFELNITSAPNEGTKIEMLLPILLDDDINKFKNTSR